jgi:predicted amidohydrolase
MVATAAGAGAALVVLTELFPVGFSMNIGAVAEPVDGPTISWMQEQAAARGVTLCGSVPEVPTGARLPHNTFVLAGPDGSVQRYAKIHPFTYAGEHEHYAPGHDRATFMVEGLRITPFVCYDLRFADEWWAMAPDTDCYVVVASWPAARRAHWQTLLAARAIENQAYVVGANRVGHGGEIDYVGDSKIIDPLGTVLADGTGDGEIVLTADIDAATVASTRALFPFLQDRR